MVLGRREKKVENQERQCLFDLFGNAFFDQTTNLSVIWHSITHGQSPPAMTSTCRPELRRKPRSFYIDDSHCAFESQNRE